MKPSTNDILYWINRGVAVWDKKQNKMYNNNLKFMFDYEADIFNFRYYPHKRDTQKEKKLRSLPPSHHEDFYGTWKNGDMLLKRGVVRSHCRSLQSKALVHHVEDQLAGLENGPFQSPVVGCLEQSKG